MASYPDLILDRSKIDSVIEESKEDSIVIKKETERGSTFNFNFSDQRKTAILHVYLLKDGKTTLHYGQGKNTEFSKIIADKIIEKTLVKVFEGGKLYFAQISDENFEFIKSFINDIGGNIQEKVISSGMQFVVTGIQGEVIYINHYTNKAIYIQGRPSIIFNQMIDILLDIFPPNEVLTGQLGYYNINTSEKEIKSEFETIYPNCYNGINEKLKAIIAPSIVLKKLTFDLSDFSFITFPVLKGLEGVIKMIYFNKGEIINNEGLGEYFKYSNTSRKFIASERTTALISCTKTTNALAEMYNHFNKNRHSIFHADSITPKTITQAEAITIVDETLNLIEDSFVVMNN